MKNFSPPMVITRAVTLLLAVMFVAGRADWAEAQPYSSVSLGITTEVYYGTDYTLPPASELAYMFYAGEPIYLKVGFVNTGNQAVVLPLTPPGRKSLFAATFSSGGNSVPGALRLSGRVELEGSLDTSAITIAGDRLILEPDEKVILYGEVASLPADPGLYSIEISTDLVDTLGRPVAPQSTRLDFELRLPTAGETVQIAVRRAQQAIADGNLRAAESFASQLIGLNANSSAAFRLRGQIAEVEGRITQALSMYRRALAIVESSTDPQLRTNQGLLREAHVDGLRARIKSLEDQR